MLVKDLTINCTASLETFLAQSVYTLPNKRKVEGSSPPVTILFFVVFCLYIFVNNIATL